MTTIAFYDRTLCSIIAIMINYRRHLTHYSSTTCRSTQEARDYTYFADDITVLWLSECRILARCAATESSYLPMTSASGGVSGAGASGDGTLTSCEKMLQRSSILICACSMRSKMAGSCVSSSKAEPQPSTRAKSLPVPRGRTPIWHYDATTYALLHAHTLAHR